MRVPCTVRRSNQSILKKPWVFTEGLMLKLTPGDGDGQGSLECCGSWGRKESDTTERLNWTDRDRSEVTQSCPTLQPHELYSL